MRVPVAVGKLIVSCCGIALVVLAEHQSAASDWPQWRGSLRSGYTEEVNMPLTWDGKSQENLLWKVPVDFGHSSPVVRGDRVYLSCSARRDKKGKDSEAANHLHSIACFRVNDGTKLWRTNIEPGTWDAEFSFTASTPTTDDKQIYALFGSGTIAALDLDGKLIWQKTLPGPIKAEWQSSSPILYKDSLLVFCDISEEHWLFALDKKTGAVQWEHKRKQHNRAHNSSPLLLMVKDKPLLVVASSTNVIMALDPTADKVIWTCTWSGNRYPTLVAGSGLVYIAGDGGSALAIDPTGEGDVTKTHVKWRHSKSGQGFGSPIIVGDYLYRANSPGIVKCWKLSDGEPMFEERVDGVPTHVSPVATKDGRIYFASASKTIVIKASPKLEVLSTNNLEESRGEGGSNGPSAAISDGRIFLRSPKTLYCVGKKSP